MKSPPTNLESRRWSAAPPARASPAHRRSPRPGAKHGSARQQVERLAGSSQGYLRLIRGGSDHGCGTLVIVAGRGFPHRGRLCLETRQEGLVAVGCREGGRGDLPPPKRRSSKMSRLSHTVIPWIRMPRFHSTATRPTSVSWSRTSVRVYARCQADPPVDRPSAANRSAPRR